MMLPSWALLRPACNEAVMSTLSDGTSLTQRGLRVLEARLPPRWRAAWQKLASKRNDVWYDGMLRITAPDGRRASLAVEAKSRIEPRDALRIAGLAARLENTPLLVLSPFLSEATRGRLREASLNWLDLTGNVRLVLPDPGVFVETEGARKQPAGGERPARSLKGVSAGRIVRALLAVSPPVGVRDLAQRAGIDAGYVSRVLELLNDAALVERGPRGQVERVDRARLLRRWAADAPLEKRGEQAVFLEPRGLSALMERLKSAGVLTYAVTGSLAAQRWAPVAPPRLAQVYVDADLLAAAAKLELRPTESGANVQLIRPRDDAVFEASKAGEDGLTYASPVQVAADLLTSPGRGPAEGEELLRWMAEREEPWRG
jgi:hypothetical protein